MTHPLNVDPTAPLLWVDVETTGLAPGSRIIDIAVCVTDADLRPLDIPLTRVLRVRPEDSLDWESAAAEMHGRSGLAAQCVNAWDSSSEKSAETSILNYLRGLGIEPGRAPLVGSSVHFDRRVLTERMPALAAFAHRRNIDVSTLMELAARWRPDLVPKIAELRRGLHRALLDLEDSINVLRLLRREWLVAKAEPAPHVSISRTDTDAFFAAYHEEHPSWGSLHLVLEDGNLRDEDVEFCIGYAVDNSDAIGCVLGRMLAQMTVDERDALSRRT